MNRTNPDTQANILATARDLFAKGGYDGTSIRSICARAGVNLGAVTYHFGSKAGLYEQVIASVVEPLRDAVVAVGAKPSDPLRQLEAIIAVYFSHFADAPDLPKLVIQEVFTGRPLTAVLRASMQTILRTLGAILLDGQARGVVRDGSPHLLALSLLAQPIYFNIVRGPLATAGLLDLGDPAQRQITIEHVTRFALAGLAPPAGGTA
jgi:AcrR family transcriptional regulator